MQRQILREMKRDPDTTWQQRAQGFEHFKPDREDTKPSEWYILLAIIRLAYYKLIGWISKQKIPTGEACQQEILRGHASEVEIEGEISEGAFGGETSEGEVSKGKTSEPETSEGEILQRFLSEIPERETPERDMSKREMVEREVLKREIPEEEILKAVETSEDNPITQALIYSHPSTPSPSRNPPIIALNTTPEQPTNPVNCNEDNETSGKKLAHHTSSKTDCLPEADHRKASNWFRHSFLRGKSRKQHQAGGDSDQRLNEDV